MIKVNSLISVEGINFLVAHDTILSSIKLKMKNMTETSVFLHYFLLMFIYRNRIYNPNTLKNR